MKTFGGFVEVAWSTTNKYFTDNNAYIFSLVNKENLPFVINFSYLPTFGWGHDRKSNI